MKKKVVLDTNIFISALKKGTVRKVLNLWLDDCFDLLVSDAILKELFDVLKRPKFNFSWLEIEELGVLIYEKALVVNSRGKIKVCDDPDDNKFIECAVEGKANCIVSGDKALLRLEEFQGIQILKPSDFIKEYK